MPPALRAVAFTEGAGARSTRSSVRCSRPGRKSSGSRAPGAHRAPSDARFACWGRSSERMVSTISRRRAPCSHAPARLERAKALAALGETLRHARRPTEAASHSASRWSSPRSAARRRWSNALAPRSTRPVRALEPLLSMVGVTDLERTPRRSLAADGLSNRDIAQTLYVTPKTVEVHLSNVYPQARDRLKARPSARAIACRLSRRQSQGGDRG